MINKRTIVDQIEVTRNGIIQVRFRKEVVEDGNVLSFGYHRTSFVPDGSVDDQMNLVNDDLSAMGNAPVTTTEILRVRDVTGVVHTSKVVAEYLALLSSIEGL